jgi:ribulose kinase
MSKHNSSERAQFYIGVDGGGTSCRARIEDAAGHLLGEGAAGPAATRLGTVRRLPSMPVCRRPPSPRRAPVWDWPESIEKGRVKRF